MNNLKKLREDREIKQLEVAKYLGISRAGYSQIEANIKNARGSNLIKIANFFNVSVDYLLELTDEPTPLFENQDECQKITPPPFNSIELKKGDKESIVRVAEILQEIIKK